MTAIKSQSNQVSAVDLQNTRTGETRELLTGGVFIFMGFNPNNQLAPTGTKINPDGYVCTDEKCETSLPGRFGIYGCNRSWVFSSMGKLRSTRSQSNFFDC